MFSPKEVESVIVRAVFTAYGDRFSCADRITQRTPVRLQRIAGGLRVHLKGKAEMQSALRCGFRSAAIFVGVTACASGGTTDIVSPAKQTVATVKVDPDSGGLVIGGTIQFVATAVDAAGNAMQAHTFSWASSSPAIATVSAQGVATAVAAGATAITAIESTTGKQGTARIVVSVPTTTIGVTGGVVQLPGGGSISFPAGALGAATPISFEKSADPATAVPGAIVAGSTIRLGPSGLDFQELVTLTLPVPPGVSPSDVRIAYFDTASR